MATKSPIRVVVVDDSPTVRDLFVAIFQEAGDIEVVGLGENGEDAIELVRQLKPDVVTMDINMPKMDGLEATRRIMREQPTPVVVVSSMKQHDLDLTFQAMRAGALTVLNKPGLADPKTFEQIVQAVRSMAGVPVIHHWGRLQSKPVTEPKKPVFVPGKTMIDLQNSNIQAVAIAASTGGPAALASLFGSLPAKFPLPIMVVQHITPGFAQGFASWLGTTTKLPVDVAEHGEVVQPGKILIAPDDYHLKVAVGGVVQLSKEPPYKGLRPSANPFFRSVAGTYGPRALGVILTGMGDDGADGMEALHDAGGYTLAQDESTCVVYGMPREAVIRNAIDQILSLSQISNVLERLGKSNLGYRANEAL